MDKHDNRKKPVLRSTRQRQVIIEELCKTRSHPTADELYQRVREIMPNVSLGTVYRNLELLSTQGIIQKIETSGGQKRFDGNASNHSHIRCIECNKVFDIDMDVDLDLHKLPKTIGNHQILGYRLEIFGRCSSCRMKLEEINTNDCKNEKETG